jgi:hypothetical protein
MRTIPSSGAAPLSSLKVKYLKQPCVMSHFHFFHFSNTQIKPFSFSLAPIIRSQRSLEGVGWCRYNAKTAQYRRHVGSKTTVMFQKDLYNARGQAGSIKPPGLKYYLLNQKQAVKKAPTLVYRGLPALVLGPDQDRLWKIAIDIYDQYKPGSTTVRPNPNPNP